MPSGPTQTNSRTYEVAQLRARAEQGDSDAQLNLGMMYDHGDGVPQDNEQAAAWLRKAADQGNAEAQFKLGLGYHLGSGVPQDHAQAAVWYRKAAEQGHARAQSALGDYLSEAAPWDECDPDWKYLEAVEWYLKAAKQGHAGAQYSIGWMRWHGYGVQQNWPQAAVWYRKAANQGHAPAQERLAEMYAEGEGLQQDNVQAHKWFNLASSCSPRTGGQADKGRDAIALRMTSAQVTEAQRLAQVWTAAFERRSTTAPLNSITSTPPSPSTPSSPPSNKTSEGEKKSQLDPRILVVVNALGEMWDRAQEAKQKQNTAQLAFNPEIADIVIELLNNYIETGVNEFREAVRQAVEQFGDPFVRKIAVYLDAGWENVFPDGGDVSTLATLDTLAPPKKPESVPPPAPPAVNDTATALKAVGTQTTPRPDGLVNLSGNTFDNRATISKAGVPTVATRHGVSPPPGSTNSPLAYEDHPEILEHPEMQDQLTSAILASDDDCEQVLTDGLTRENLPRLMAGSVVKVDPIDVAEWQRRRGLENERRELFAQLAIHGAQQPRRKWDRYQLPSLRRLSTRVLRWGTGFPCCSTTAEVWQEPL